ncbi:uncharacterized protein LOC122005160 [Zingiber officinale]|uniref:uncharacterized protein LOC122005160 n=1 Tax=Zingiber officinale TaxID=94328 RepID=UPI001C4BD77B|nr:uncharacterized protein LOC122005160 [Zingiber officinale]
MAVSVFKSSSKRGAYASPSTTSSSTRDRPIEDSGKKIPLRRSRSIVSSPRSNENSTSKHFLEYANTRDNPLFDCTSSSPSSPEAECLSEAMKSDVLECRRGRSLVKHSNFRSESTCSARERSSSRDMVRQSRVRSLSRGQSHISEDRHWEERNSRDYFSETESSMRNYYQIEHFPPDLESGGLYEMVRSEVHSAVSEITTNLENVIKRKVPVDSIGNVPPELVNQDEIELVPDIQREYTFMLEQSQERIRKLQADLAIEEQRRHELSRILNNIVLENEKSSSTRKSKMKRKASIERLKMSRRLAEEAMTYFDECVSLSAFDGSDFSSQEDQQINSTLGVISTRNRRFLSNGCSSYAISDYPITQFEHHEGLDNDNRPSHSSSVSDSTIINHCIDRALDIIHHNGGDDLPEFYTPRKGNSYFQYGDEPAGSLGLHKIRNDHTGSVGAHEIRNYIPDLEKTTKSIEGVKEESTYNAKDYSSTPSDESLLFEKVTFRNRINFGGMLVCSINTF